MQVVTDSSGASSGAVVGRAGSLVLSGLALGLAGLLWWLARQPLTTREGPPGRWPAERPPERVPVVIPPRQGADRPLAPDRAEDSRERWLRLRAVVKGCRARLPALRGAERADTAFELWVAAACLWLDAQGKGRACAAKYGSGTLTVSAGYAMLMAHGRRYRVEESWLPDVDRIHRLTSYLEQERQWRPGHLHPNSPLTEEWIAQILEMAERALRISSEEPVETPFERGDP